MTIYYATNTERTIHATSSGPQINKFYRRAYPCFSVGLNAVAQNQIPKDTVATVNGIAITYNDVSLVEDELMAVYGQLPEEQRFQTLVGYMVNRILASSGQKSRAGERRRRRQIKGLYGTKGIAGRIHCQSADGARARRRRDGLL